MTDWRGQFLSVIASHKPHVFVGDKDDLLAYKSLQDAIGRAGFRIVRCDTSLALRVAFELDIRHSASKYLVYAATRYPLLPDIREQFGAADVSIGDIFKCLDRKTIAGLDERILDILYPLSRKLFDPLTGEQTIKFILENIYDVDMDGLGSKARLLGSLSTIYNEPYTLNAPVLGFLSKRFQKHFPDTVSETVSQKSFFPFLQKKWEAFIRNRSEEIDFEESSLKKAMITAFVTGRLMPVKVNRSVFENLPAKIGVFHDEHQSRQEDAMRLMAHISNYLEQIENDPKQWFYLVQLAARNRLMSLEWNDPEATNETDWINAGYAAYQCVYARFGAACGDALSVISALAGSGSPFIAALVCNDLDDTMHGNVMGLSQYYVDTRHWLEKIRLPELIIEIKRMGFTVFITSDHGNVAARGIASLKSIDKFGSLSRSRRHLDFTNEIFLSSFIQRHPELNAGIIDRSIYLRDSGAFTSTDQIIITHGGSHFWEVLVPFIEI